jgi:hypothetical protein
VRHRDGRRDRDVTPQRAANGAEDQADMTTRAAKGAGGKRVSTLVARVRAVPAPLAAILVVVVLTGLMWALLVPPWQAPDEDSHFAYAQSLA